MSDFKPFVTWNVSRDEDASESYKLVLEADQICSLEQKFGGKNLLSLIGDNSTGLPSLNVMLTVIQAAMQRYNHGMDMKAVKELFNKYVANGGSQVDLYSEVYVGIFSASGFFPRAQAEEMQETLKNVNAAED